MIELLVAKDFDEKYYFIDYFGDDIPWLFLFYIPMLIYFLKSTKKQLCEEQKIMDSYRTVFFLLALIHYY
ncbi:hypothetical protein M667_18375 [Cellulophaga baltica NN016038]|nr:hypothetical protein M667_18375 [Cellulophaga baltica NN016038]